MHFEGFSPKTFENPKSETCRNCGQFSARHFEGFSPENKLRPCPESKHRWCVRHLKHHSNLSPRNARSMYIWNQPPYESNTTSFEDSGLSLFYKTIWCKRFFFPVRASLKFQAKAPEIAEAVAAEAVEVLLLRKVFVFLPDELQEIVLLK